MYDEAKTATETTPIWQRAHQTLNDMRSELMKYREELQARGRDLEESSRQIDNALARIAPPTPEPISQPISSGTTFQVNSVPSVQRW